MSTHAPILTSQRLARMTEEEYVEWAFQQEFKSEWVDGEVVLMAPVSGEHDELQAWLRAFLELYANRKDLGKVRGPEFQVRLPHPSRREPDVLFVSKPRLHLLTRTYLDGPPDLAIEIVSPESESRDWREKYLEYQSAGVREYWVLDPASQHVEAYALGPAGQAYARIAETEDGKLPSAVVPGWYVRPAWLWQEPRFDVLHALAELGVR